MPKIRNRNGSYWLALERAERDIIASALRAAGGSRTNAAALLGIDRWFMVKRMRHLGLDEKVEPVRRHWLLEGVLAGVRGDQ